MTHTCHAIGCNTLIPPKLFMCKPCWSEISRADQTLVYDLYVPGQEIRKDPSVAYIEATSRIIREQAVRRGIIKGEIICDGCKKFKPFRINLDGDDLCQECADDWVKGEGIAAADLERHDELCEDEGCPHFGEPHTHIPASVINQLQGKKS